MLVICETFNPGNSRLSLRAGSELREKEQQPNRWEARMAKHLGDNEISSTASTSPPPEGIDRRSFLMRHAVIGAAAVMTGTTWTAGRARATGREGGVRSETRRDAFSRPECGQGRQGPGDDPGRRVLQGRTWPLELAHDRADAHHLRLLPALHQAAGRPVGPGHRAEGAPVRQPQRDRQGTRHGACVACRAARQGAGHGRSRCSSTR